MNAKTLFAVAIALFLSGCAITQTVRPVGGAADIREICIKRNMEVFMTEFVDELKKQLEAKGIKSQVYAGGTAPASCRYRMEYSANWRWDLAMYLVFAQLRVFDNDVMIGEANYDARAGGMRMDKFGRTADKLRALLDELIPSRR